MWKVLDKVLRAATSGTDLDVNVQIHKVFPRLLVCQHRSRREEYTATTRLLGKEVLIPRSNLGKEVTVLIYKMMNADNKEEGIVLRSRLWKFRQKMINRVIEDVCCTLEDRVRLSDVFVEKYISDIADAWDMKHGTRTMATGAMTDQQTEDMWTSMFYEENCKTNCQPYMILAGTRDAVYLMFPRGFQRNSAFPYLKFDRQS